MIKSLLYTFLVVFNFAAVADEIRVPVYFAETLETACWWPWSDNDEKKSKDRFLLEKVETLEERLLKHIHGQNNAVKITAESFLRYAVGLHGHEKPIATLLYIGPTGVGKTQLAKALTKELLGDPKQKMLRIDLSEYTSYHDAHRLFGSPPGYVAYNEGGQLTNWIKDHPYTIVLLDEIDKTCLEVLRVFLHVFDAGRITSGKGEIIDCTNCIFILTSNLCANKILTLSDQGYSNDSIADAIRPELVKIITPELYNRLEPVVFGGLSRLAMDKIILDMLADVAVRVQQQKNIAVSFDQTLIDYLLEKGFDYELGARPLERLINKQVVTALAYGLVQKKYLAGDCLLMSYCLEEAAFVITKQ